MRVVRYYPRALVGDGGIAGSNRKLSRELARAGAEVVIAFEAGPEAPAPNGVRWAAVRHDGPAHLRVPVGMETVLEGADVLVLHSAWTLCNARAAATARKMGVPYVLEPRGGYDPAVRRRRRILKRIWWTALERALVEGARGIHVFFESELEHVRSLGYAGGIIVAPNGIEIPEGVGWDGGSSGRILWLGRFDPEHKGLDVLLEAVRLLSPDDRPYLLLRGPDWRGGKERVRRMVADLGLTGWVAVEEPVYGAEKWETIARARGFVYPSRWEGFGNSVAEAVTAGVPTLTTPYPLGRYLAARGGALLAEATPAGLAAGLPGLLAPEAGETARRGSRILREEMSWSAVARSWLAQVEALL
jgi:glycosyltransferase involved in cell wall biosynthesis